MVSQVKRLRKAGCRVLTSSERQNTGTGRVAAPSSSGIEAVRFAFGASDYAHNEFARHGEEGHGEEEHEDEHEEEAAGFSVGQTFTNRQQEARLEVQHRPVGTRFGPLSGAVGVQWDHADTKGISFEGDSLSRAL